MPLHGMEMCVSINFINHEIIFLTAYMYLSAIFLKREYYLFFVK